MNYKALRAGRVGWGGLGFIYCRSYVWYRFVELRPLLSDTGGGGGQFGPPGFWLTHPPTHIRKFFLRKKMKFMKGARTWRSILGTQTFFLASDPPTHPPPPRYSINQPLSKGLGSISFTKEGSVGMPISLCFSIINFWYSLMCFQVQDLQEAVCSVLCQGSPAPV